MRKYPLQDGRVYAYHILTDLFLPIAISTATTPNFFAMNFSNPFVNEIMRKARFLVDRSEGKGGR